MSDNLSPIEQANKFFGKSGFRLVLRFDENQERTGYVLQDKTGDLYEIHNLDMDVAATSAIAFFDGTGYGLHLGEGQHGLKGIGVQASIDNLRAGAITGITITAALLHALLRRPLFLPLRGNHGKTFTTKTKEPDLQLQWAPPDTHDIESSPEFLHA